MVSERIYGVPVSDSDTLKKQVDIKLLAERGVEIFFTQVFRDSFFTPTCTPATFSSTVRTRMIRVTWRWTAPLLVSLMSRISIIWRATYSLFFSRTTGCVPSYTLVRMDTRRHPGGRI